MKVSKRRRILILMKVNCDDEVKDVVEFVFGFVKAIIQTKVIAPKEKFVEAHCAKAIRNGEIVAGSDGDEKEDDNYVNGSDNHVS